MRLPRKGDLFMKVSIALLASAGSLFFVAPVAAADPSLIADAKAFGAREAVQPPDLSADGSSVVYITPAGGQKSVAVVGNLDTGKFTQMVASDGMPTPYAGAISLQRHGRSAGSPASIRRLSARS